MPRVPISKYKPRTHCYPQQIIRNPYNMSSKKTITVSPSSSSDCKPNKVVVGFSSSFEHCYKTQSFVPSLDTYPVLDRKDSYQTMSLLSCSQDSFNSLSSTLSSLQYVSVSDKKRVQTMINVENQQKELKRAGKRLVPTQA